MKDRVLALAGLLQAVECVEALARDGQKAPARARPLLQSVFRIDADSTPEVFGGAAELQRGLELLAAHAAGNPGSSAPLARIGFTVLQLERTLARRPDMLQSLRLGIEDIHPDSGPEGVLDALVIARLGDLYARTLSTLQPRVLVQGDPAMLSRSDVVSSIRALLLAAVRCAVLWRQLGGSYWDFFLRRGTITRSAALWLRLLQSE